MKSLLVILGVAVVLGVGEFIYINASINHLLSEPNSAESSNY